MKVGVGSVGGRVQMIGNHLACRYVGQGCVVLGQSGQQYPSTIVEPRRAAHSRHGTRDYDIGEPCSTTAGTNMVRST